MGGCSSGPLNPPLVSPAGSPKAFLGSPHLTFHHLDGVQVGGQAGVDVKDFLRVPDHAQEVTGQHHLQTPPITKQTKIMRSRPPKKGSRSPHPRSQPPPTPNSDDPGNRTPNGTPKKTPPNPSPTHRDPSFYIPPIKRCHDPRKRARSQPPPPNPPSPILMTQAREH